MADYATRSYSFDSTDVLYSTASSTVGEYELPESLDKDSLNTTPDNMQLSSIANAGLGKAPGLVASPNFRAVGIDANGTLATPIVKTAFQDKQGNTWRVIGDAQIEGQVVEAPTMEEALLTQSFGGWNLDDDPGDDDSKTQSHLQWAYGPGGGKTQYIKDIPNGFKPIMKALDDTYKPTMLPITAPQSSSTTHSPNPKYDTATTTCPTVPDGNVFEKIVVRTWRKWSGPSGTQAYAKIRLPSGLEVESDVVTADSNGGIINYEYTTTDPNNIGKAFSATFHKPDNATPNTTNPSTPIDAGITTTLYYRHDYYQEQPVTSPGSYKSVVVGSQMGDGMLYFSTFGHLFTCNAVWAFNTKTLVDSNLQGNRLRADDYRDMINSVAVAGAAKMVYNMIMGAINRVRTRNTSVVPNPNYVPEQHNREEKFSTWSVVTPWHASWVIDGRNDILSHHEIATNNFELLAKDLGANLLDWEDSHFEPTIGGWQPVNKSCELTTDTNLPASGVQSMKMTALTPAGASSVRFNRLTPSTPSTTAGQNASRTRYGTDSLTSSQFLLITVFSEQLMGATPSDSAPKIPKVSGLGIQNVRQEATTRRTASDLAKQFRVTVFSATGTGGSGPIDIDFGTDVQVSCYWTVHEVFNANAVLQTTWGANATPYPSLVLDDVPSPVSALFGVIHQYYDDDLNVQPPLTITAALVTPRSVIVPAYPGIVQMNPGIDIIVSTKAATATVDCVTPNLADDTHDTVGGWIEDVDFLTRSANRLAVVHRNDPQDSQVTWNEAAGKDWAAIVLEVGYEGLGSAAAIAESGSFAVVPGKPYFATANVRRGSSTFVNALGETSTEIYDRSMRVGFRFYDSNNTLIGTQYAATQVFLHEDIPVYGLAVDSRGCDVQTSTWWTQIGCTAKAPVNSVRATVSVGYYPETYREWQYVDEVEVNCLDPDYVYQRRLSNKTYGELIDEQIRNTDWEEKLAGLPRIYQLEVTNSNVSVPRKRANELFPYAWTEVYTPKFSVPQEIGPHVVREELVIGDYSTLDYAYKTYPPKPWNAQIRVIGPDADVQTQKFSWIATGTGVATTNKQDWSVPNLDTTSATILFNWAIHKNENASQFQFTPGVPYVGTTNQPWGIQLGSEVAKSSDAAIAALRTCWPSYGIFGVWKYGDSSDVILFVQQALNILRKTSKLGLSGPLQENGKFDAKTKTAIAALIDAYGVADYSAQQTSSELIGPAILSVIGAQILDLGPTRTGRTDGYFGTIFGSGGPNKLWLSDGTTTNRYMLVSSTEDVPTTIMESFIFSFPRTYKIAKVNVTAGNTPNQILQSIDLIDSTRMNTNTSTDGPPPGTLSTVKPGVQLVPNQQHSIAVGPYEADQIVITIRQETDSVNRAPSTGEFSTLDVVPAHKRIEIADISFEAVMPRVEWAVVSKQYDVKTSQWVYTYSATIHDSGEAEVSADRDLNLRAEFKYSNAPANTDFSHLTWTSVTVSNENVTGSIAADGLMTFRLNSVYNAATNPSIDADANYTFGPILGQSSHDLVYTMDEFGKRRALPDTGWISKNDGILLLAKADGSPYGFSNIVPNRPFFPTSLGKVASSRLAMKLRLERFNTDGSIFLSFYDKKQQEFITSVTGQPEISYSEYMRRGPSNVYVGLIADYETQRVEEIPYNDAPKLPQRWAMPVYGLVKKRATPISLSPISPNLGIDDIWPAAVRSGSFIRSLQVRPVSEGYLTTWLRDYQGTVVEAHYRVAEADNAGWSTIFGQPYRDIRNETPLLLDDAHLQVRQPPIHAVMEPTPRSFNQLANPVRPTFRVSVRATYDDDWRILPLTEIDDWNLSTGDIFLSTPLINMDPNLVKVDYVTANGLVHFKQFNGTLLNLNPYPGGRNSGQAIYIYILPEYVKSAQKTVIPQSYNSHTLRFTTNSNIFDYLKPEYDPLAYQLGVIYVNAAMDSSDLIVVDARRRGGGLIDTMTGSEYLNVIAESIGYWDIGHGYGEAYQKGGFVIIRLPGELKDRMTEAEIRGVIDRSITAGVRYELQDLNGVDWSQ